VEHNCRLHVLKSALRSKLGPSIKSNEELVLAQHEETRDAWQWFGRQDDVRMADTMLGSSNGLKYTYYAFRCV
jgi:hypothetical protein